MMQRLFLAGFALLALVLVGCGGSAVVATIGDEKITQSEFEDIYAKNNGGWDSAAVSTVEDRQKFLDLILKFKLKVKEARNQGLMKDSAVVDEIQTYRNSVAQSYILEKEIIEPGVKRMYDRKKEELRASHILFRAAQNASPADTLAAWEKATKTIGAATRTPFDTLAKALSEDPGASFNSGDLGWFSSGRMVQEFEDAVYGLKVGEVTPVPVRTQFGYHVIKLTGRQPYKGQARIAHILRRFDQSKNMSDSTEVRDSVMIIYKLLKSGMNWEEAQQQYSEDPNTKMNGGEIGVYDRDRVPPLVSNQVWNLQKDSVGEPLQFPYGYHILKVMEFLGLPSFADAEKDFKQQYQQQRYQGEYQKFVKQLQAQFGFKFDDATVAALKQSFDSTVTALDSAWSKPLTATFKTKAIFTYTGGAFTVGDFEKKLNTTDEFKTYTLIASNIETILNRITENEAMTLHAATASKRYPTFGKLMEEYEEGILLYRIEQDEVWKKVVVNDSLLKIYYEANKEKYMWPDRVNFAEIQAISDSAMKEVKWRLAYGEDFRDVAFDYTVRPGYKEKKGEWGFQTYTANELSQRAAGMAVDSVSDAFMYQGRPTMIKVLAKESPRMKTFEEAGPETASGYQEQASKQREQEWVDSLMKKYPITKNNEVVANSFKKKPSEK